MRLRQHLAASILAAALGAAAPTLWAQPCQPYWSQGFATTLQSTANFVEFDDGSGAALYGILTSAQRMFRWRDGDPAWTPIEAGLPQFYQISWPLLVLDDGSGPHLCANGSASGNRFVARWNGSEWEFPWPGMVNNTSASGYPITSADVGDGAQIYGRQLIGNRVYPIRWVGGLWQTFGTPLNGDVGDMVILDDGGGSALFITGGFTTIGGVAAPGHMARYRNGQWTGLGDGQTVGTPRAVLDDGSGPALYTDSFGSLITQQGYRGLARFNGHEWVLVGQMNPPGAVYSLGGPIAFDDGRGPAVYVFGSFSNMGGVPADGIARYDGHTWSTLGDGVRGNVGAVAALPGPRGPSLFLGGNFFTAGGGSVYATARWVGCPNCYANCDLSTRAPVLNVNDFLCFMSKFARGAPEANCDNNASLDVNDFVCFLGRFAGGCL